MDSTKHEADEEGEAFLRPGAREDDVADSLMERQRRGGSNPRKWEVSWYLRLLLEVAMAATIVYLLVFKPFVVTREAIWKTPVPQCMLPKMFRVLMPLLTMLVSSSTQDLYISRQPPICPRRYVVQRVADPTYSPQLD